MEPENLQSEFRVGCWDARYEDDWFYLQHDDSEEELKLELEDLHDLEQLCHLLDLRELASNNPEDYEERFETMARELEA